MTDKLKPCPFCGNDGSGPISEALQIAMSEGHWNGTRWSVQCDKCTGTIGYVDSEESAITAWNTRAPVDASPAADSRQRVKVKPLVWEDPSNRNNWLHVARTVFGDYYISIDGGRHRAWLEAHVKPYDNMLGECDVGSVYAAQEVAQADYEARRAALEDTQ